MAELVRESRKQGFPPVGDPYGETVLSPLLETPDPRVRAALPFRDELEDTLGMVTRNKDTR
jgi:hypothetical protein